MNRPGPGSDLFLSAHTCAAGHRAGDRKGQERKLSPPTMCRMSFSVRPSLRRRVFISGRQRLWRRSDICRMTDSSCVEGGRWPSEFQPQPPSLQSPSAWGGHTLGEGNRARAAWDRSYYGKCFQVDLGDWSLNLPEEL